MAGFDTPLPSLGIGPVRAHGTGADQGFGDTHRFIREAILTSS